MFLESKWLNKSSKFNLSSKSDNFKICIWEKIVSENWEFRIFEIFKVDYLKSPTFLRRV